MQNYQQYVDCRSREMLERAMADEEMQEAVREGIEAVRRGEKGTPLRQVQEELRQEREGR